MTTAPSCVVAYEATPQGNDAIELGVALARLTGAELHLCLVLHRLTTVPAKVPASASDFAALLEEQASDWLEGAKERVPAGIPVRTHVIWADGAAEGLIEAATRLGADRIVVGAARGGLLNRFSIGSVANSLLHASLVPVALAPRGYLAPERVSRITCFIGTRPGWEALLDSMVAVSEGLDVALRFVTLVELDTDRTRALDSPDAHSSSEQSADSEDHLAAVLDNFRARSRGNGTVTTEVARGSDVEKAVEGLDWQTDEIVFVGSSRLAAARTIFLGITANRMLHALPVPLIVVPKEALTRSAG